LIRRVSIQAALILAAPQEPGVEDIDAGCQGDVTHSRFRNTSPERFERPSLGYRPVQRMLQSSTEVIKKKYHNHTFDDPTSIG